MRNFAGQQPVRPRRSQSPRRLSRAGASFVFFVFLLSLAGCSDTEIRGSYDVEVDIAGIGTSLDGVLILAAEFLDIPPLEDEERAIFGDWFVSDTIDANSCFILESASRGEEATKIVRVFETRLRGNEIVLPIEIFRTPSNSIEIVDLKFFANTTGGSVVFHDRDRQREGRIRGVRSGPPSAAKCLEELETFRADLRESIRK